MHTAFLDATGAFDSVPHVALDVALWRLGAGEGFVTWLRSMLQGHTRVIATAYGVTEDSVAMVLQAGEPQGCPASPIIWAIIMDMALTHARQVGGEGVEVEGEKVGVLAFADDLAAADRKKEGLRKTVQALVVTMGAVGVRFNGKKSFYAWSKGAIGGGKAWQCGR